MRSHHPDSDQAIEVLARPSSLSSSAARRLQELVDTHARSRVGGVFYVAGWALAAGSAGLFQTQTLATVLIGAAFLALALVRFVVPPPPIEDERAQSRWLLRAQAVMLSSATLWGAVSYWITADESLGQSRTVTVFSNVAFATAFAQTFAMRLGPAFIGSTLAMVPSMIALATSPTQRSLALGLLVYLAYVVVVTFRSHAEYVRRLDAEQQLREQRDLFERQSRRDALTGLANRRRFAATLESDWRDAVRDRSALALLILDLDHFKAINDRHGHAVGDLCLMAFAERLRGAFGSQQELAARIGGEEFAVLMAGTAAAMAEQRAQVFREALAAQPLPAGDLELALTVSIGVGLLELDHDLTPDDLYRRVDRALYAAKADGRNRVCVATSKIQGLP